MTNIKGSSKRNRKDNKKNDMNRPTKHMENKKTPPRYESFDGVPME